MHAIGLFLQTGILWLLITLFTRSTDSQQTLNETRIVIFAMLAVGFVTKFLLRPYLGPFSLLVDVAALYWLVDKVCGNSRNITFKICLWYFLISILFALFFAVMSA